jgi:ribosomal protein S18 acetylase RimI-like enzyme
MQIRPYETADANAVNSVALSAFAQYESIYQDWETLTRGVGSMSSLAGHSELIVAEERDRIIGAVAYCAPGSTPRAEFFDPEWPIIRMLVVEPSARGKGVGRRLTDECIERARRTGAPLIALHTSPAMEAALKMYLKMGFTVERAVAPRFGVSYAVYTLNL